MPHGLRRQRAPGAWCNAANLDNDLDGQESIDAAPPLDLVAGAPPESIFDLEYQHLIDTGRHG
jgi:hypothetical protein